MVALLEDLLQSEREQLVLLQGKVDLLGSLERF
jgi:hypothetical protein